MHVEHLVGREQRLLDQHAVRAHGDRLGLGGGDPVERLRLVQPLGLDEVEAELARLVRDGWRREPAAAALRPALAEKIVVVKSTHHFHAGYSPLAADVLYIGGPGSLERDLARLPFRKIRRPKWPLDQV